MNPCLWFAKRPSARRWRLERGLGSIGNGHSQARTRSDFARRPPRRDQSRERTANGHSAADWVRSRDLVVGCSQAQLATFHSCKYRWLRAPANPFNRSSITPTVAALQSSGHDLNPRWTPESPSISIRLWTGCGSAPTHSPSRTFRNSAVHRSIPVNHGVCPEFQGVSDTVLTQSSL